MLASVSGGSTISGYAGTNNGLGVAASTAYTYNATSKSYSFDATALTNGDGTAGSTKVADVLKAYAANGDNTAQISIGGSAQEVKIASDGTLTDTNGDALYIGADGNLTKNRPAAQPRQRWTVFSTVRMVMMQLMRRLPSAAA